MDDKELCRQILGVVAPWEIENIDLNMDKNRVDIYLQWPYKQEGICPECGKSCKIQHIEATASGFRNFDNYRTSILFYCGKLSLYP